MRTNVQAIVTGSSPSIVIDLEKPLEFAKGYGSKMTQKTFEFISVSNGRKRDLFT